MANLRLSRMNMLQPFVVRNDLLSGRFLERCGCPYSGLGRQGARHGLEDQAERSRWQDLFRARERRHVRKRRHKTERHCGACGVCKKEEAIYNSGARGAAVAWHLRRL